MNTQNLYLRDRSRRLYAKLMRGRLPSFVFKHHPGACLRTRALSTGVLRTGAFLVNQLRPVGLPVIRAHVLPSNRPTALPLQSDAVVRRERPLAICPLGHVSKIVIAKGLGYGQVGAEALDHLVGGILIGRDWF